MDSYRPDDRSKPDERRTSSSHRRPNSRSRSRSPTRHEQGREHQSSRRRSRSPPRNQRHSPQQPPLPSEPLPYDEGDASKPAQDPDDDGWQPFMSDGLWCFYNRFTGVTQWENPRVPEATQQPLQQEEEGPRIKPAAQGGYNPAIHGSWDPNADYAKHDEEDQGNTAAPAISAVQVAPGQSDPSGTDYSATASFNRFTGRFQNTDVHPTHDPSAHTDEAKSKRQMEAYFDVDRAANAHNGKSLKAERQGRKLSKKELEEFRDKKKKRKAEKQKAWLKD